jgi:hypothetical protein
VARHHDIYYSRKGAPSASICMPTQHTIRTTRLARVDTAEMLTASPGCTSNGALQRFTGTKAAGGGGTGAHEVQGGN